MRHLDAELLLMVLAGQVPPRTLLQVMYEHLKELCPECRSNLEMVAQELDWSLEGPDDDEVAAERVGEHAFAVTCCSVSAEEPSTGPNLYAEAFQRAEAAAVARSEEVLDERTAALQDLEELLQLPVARRRDRIRRARTRFRSRWLAELLVEECLDAVRRDPDDALSLAELVPEVLKRIPGGLEQPWGEELYARALAHRGNALRVRGDKRSADAAFFELHRFLDSRALESEDVHPELLSLEASLRDNQYRFGEALELLDRAVVAAREIGDTKELARYLVQRSALRRFEDDLSGARDDQRAALELLDPEDDTHLYLCTVCGYSLNLCKAGEFREAAAVLDEHQGLVERHDEPWLDLQVEYQRGLIDRGLGNVAGAEERFLALRQRYADRRKPYEAAFVSLELAEIYLEQGRHAELAETATAMARIFDVAGVDSEALVAVALFQRAVASEEVTREMVGRLRTKLEKRDTGSARQVHPPS